MTKFKKIKTAKEYKEICKRVQLLENLIQNKTTEYSKQLVELEQLTDLIEEYEEAIYK